MNTRLIASAAFAFATLVLACDDESGQASSPIQGDSGAPMPNGSAGRAAPDAGTRPSDGGTASGPGSRDAATTPTAADAGARDAGSEPRADAGADEDAGADSAPDSGPPEPIPPRTDGCPDDAPLPVNRVRVLSASGQSANAVGARIQGSNSSPTTDFVDLATIETAPAKGEYAELALPNTTLYRYLRYYAPPGSQGGVAELEFYSGRRRLDGKAFGTANPDPQASFERALDGDPATAFVAAADGGGYVGLDIARGYVTDPVTFTPGAAAFATPGEVALASATANATIRYSDDGQDPKGSAGKIYAGPVAVPEGRTTIRAVASSECRFDSPIQSATYVIGESGMPAGQGLRTYHIGNSLTDTINPWLEPIADSTGVDHVYARWTIPGAPIGWLAEHQGEGFQDPEGAARFDSFVSAFAPIDHLTLQPYSDPDFESQGGAAVALLNKANEYTLNPQFWIYAQWPGRTEWTTDAFAVGGGTVYPDWQVPRMPTNWEEAMENSMLYYEAFRDYVDERVETAKPILIVPGGLALLELKRRIDAGAVPGMSDFFGTMFEDEIHLTAPAQYLVALVFYACFYQQSPEGRVTSAGAGLTDAQAAIFQQIAWSVASGYSESGIAP